MYFSDSAVAANDVVNERLEIGFNAVRHQLAMGVPAQGGRSGRNLVVNLRDR